MAFSKVSCKYEHGPHPLAIKGYGSDPRIRRLAKRGITLVRLIELAQSLPCCGDRSGGSPWPCSFIERL